MILRYKLFSEPGCSGGQRLGIAQSPQLEEIDG
jgi:hypothetical protein